MTNQKKGLDKHMKNISSHFLEQTLENKNLVSIHDIKSDEDSFKQQEFTGWDDSLDH
jgi:hypothetical protein